MEITELLREQLRMDGMVLGKSYQRVPRTVHSGVLDSIKTKLLSFVLELQDNNVTPEALGDGSIEPEVVRNAVSINIFGNNYGNVGVGEEVHQEISNVQEGDMHSLLEHLRGHGVGEEDLQELEESLRSELPDRDGGYGPDSKVGSWVKNMLSKATAGAWKVGMEKAPAILEKALEAYSSSPL